MLRVRDKFEYTSVDPHAHSPMFMRLRALWHASNPRQMQVRAMCDVACARAAAFRALWTRGRAGVAGWLVVTISQQQVPCYLRCMQGLREAQEILWEHVNEASTGTIDIGDEKKRDGQSQR